MGFSLTEGSLFTVSLTLPCYSSQAPQVLTALHLRLRRKPAPHPLVEEEEAAPSSKGRERRRHCRKLSLPPLFQGIHHYCRESYSATLVRPHSVDYISRVAWQLLYDVHSLVPRRSKRWVPPHSLLECLGTRLMMCIACATQDKCTCMCTCTFWGGVLLVSYPDPST